MPVSAASCRGDLKAKSSIDKAGALSSNRAVQVCWPRRSAKKGSRSSLPSLTVKPNPALRPQL
jgi:hypothetical protein